jgi:CHAD domain-containing protein
LLAPLLAEMLARQYQRLMDYGPRRLARPQVMHAFRKDCKRLRYVLEAFATHFDPAELARAAPVPRGAVRPT